MTAMRAAMRQDPDVILVGEMRDHETVKAGLAAAETGHFVMSTLHTTDAAETINRVIDFFPPHEQKQVRITLAGSLKGIICQRLVPRADGQGRCVSVEVCVVTGRIADAITDPDKTSTITQLIAEGGYYGMQTFDQHLVALIRDGVITLEVARAALALLDVDDFGLDDMDARVLRAIIEKFDGGPVGLGTIGAAVVRRLLRDPSWEVRVSDQRPPPRWMREACEVHTGDLRVLEQATEAFEVHVSGGRVQVRRAEQRALRTNPTS